MDLYRTAWWATWLAVGATPVALGVLVASPVMLVCLGITGAALAAVSGRRDPLLWLGTGLATAAVTAALSWSGSITFGLLLLAAASSPPVVRAVTRALRPRTRRSPVEAAQPTAEPAEPVLATVLSAELLAGPVHSLEDQPLCLAWSDSFVELKRARTLSDRLELVNLRQAYLDELEQRNGYGFRAWLRSGARPLGSPARWLSLHEADGSAEV